MKAKYLTSFFLIVVVEGILAEAVLLSMRFNAVRGHVFNYASLRLALAGAFLLVLIGLLSVVISLFRNAAWTQRGMVKLDTSLAGPKKRLFFIQGAFIISSLFLFECFLLSYLAFPIPTRPLFAWASLSSLEAWLALRIGYAHVYRERPSLVASFNNRPTRFGSSTANGSAGQIFAFT